MRSLQYYACKRMKTDGGKIILSYEIKLLLSLQIYWVKIKIYIFTLDFTSFFPSVTFRARLISYVKLTRSETSRGVQKSNDYLFAYW